MNTRFLLLALSFLPLLSAAERPTLGSIKRLDPALDALLAKGTVVEVVASGFVWSEGPVWDKENDRLLFSDVPKNTVYQWSEKEGLSVYLKPSGYTGPSLYGKESGSNGLTFDSKSQLVSCEHGDRRVSVLTEGGGKRTLADNWEGKRFNSPNDLVIHANGSVYFTDPPYGMPKGENDPNREIDFFGVYRIAPDGEVTVMDRTLVRPNGITLSPDGKIAYVAQSHGPAPIIKKYVVKDDGTFDDGAVFFDASTVDGPDKRNPDGLKTDLTGNVWTTGPGGVLVISPEGKLLGQILTGQATANCAWGDDGSTLYITADFYLCRIKTLTKGTGW